MSAAAELYDLFNSKTLATHLGRQGAEWKFIPKRVPWFRGFWERLIGLTKTSLKKVLGRAHVTLATLETMVVEIEAVLNDRPLTYLSDDLQDLQHSHPHTCYTAEESPGYLMYKCPMYRMEIMVTPLM